jgi:hypothetical protein
MKKSLIFEFIIILTLASCEKIDNEVFFKIGGGREYKFRDIALYDTSNHMLYFRKVHDEFKNIEKGSFIFMNNGEPIYSGSFWPGYSSSLPSGPYIMSPPEMYGNYALKIDNWHTDDPDIRSNPDMIAVLNQHNLLHSGLAISSSSIEISGTQLTFRFTVKNKDLSDLLIIDFDKTGPNLFHYFTRGLYIYHPSNTELFSSNIAPQSPESRFTWKIEWLSELKSGESKEFKINYTITNPLNPGEYDITFMFPGLAYQVNIDQLYQGNKRIWLGNIQHYARIRIQ